MVEEEEVTIAGDGTRTSDELCSVKMSDSPVKFSESLGDMDKISIHEPTDGKPYPSLRLDPSFKNSLESKWSNSIILQLVGTPMAFNVLIDKIKCLWKLERKFQFIDIGDNCFVFNSHCESTRLKILSEGPWIVNGCYLLPRTWIPQFCPSIDKITSTIACVRIIGLPVELYDDIVLFGIAKILGRPIELDYGSNCSATLSVEIDLGKPLKTFVMVEEMIYSVEYKNFSVICNECEKIGHRNEDCSVNLVNGTSRNEEGVKEVAPAEEMLSSVEISPSRGPWMQVGFKRKKGTNTSSLSEEEGDDSGNDNNHSSEEDEKTMKINNENHASEVAVNVEVSTSFVVPKGSNTSTLNSISQESNLTSTNDHYQMKVQEEDKRRNTSQAHLYTIVKVSLDKHLKDQIGKDLYFDLVNHDKVSSFRILKQMAFSQFKEEVSKKLGIPVQYMRFWKWADRQNSTYRPHRPLTPQEQVESVAQLIGDSKKKTLNLFLEVSSGDRHPIPYPKKTEEDNLLFLKLYDPYKEKLRYVGRLYVKGYATPAEIIPKLKELAGFSSVDDIELFEEIRFEPEVLCDCLVKSTSFAESQIGDGDIICFQKSLTPNAKKQVRYPDVPSYLESVKTRLLSKCKAG